MNALLILSYLINYWGNSKLFYFLVLIYIFKWILCDICVVWWSEEILEWNWNPIKVDKYKLLSTLWVGLHLVPIKSTYMPLCDVELVELMLDAYVNV